MSASTNDGGRTGRSDQGARLVVTRGGEPDAEQLAALTVAFATTTEVSPRVSMPAWRRAGLLEGAGRATVLAPGDLVEPGPSP